MATTKKQNGWKAYLEAMLTSEDNRQDFQDQATAVIMYAVMVGMDRDGFLSACRDSWILSEKMIRDAEEEMLKALGTSAEEVLAKAGLRKGNHDSGGQFGEPPPRTSSEAGKGGLEYPTAGQGRSTDKLEFTGNPSPDKPEYTDPLATGNRKVTIIHVDSSGMGGKKREDLN